MAFPLRERARSGRFHSLQASHPTGILSDHPIALLTSMEGVTFGVEISRGGLVVFSLQPSQRNLITGFGHNWSRGDSAERFWDGRFENDHAYTWPFLLMAGTEWLHDAGKLLRATMATPVHKNGPLLCRIQPAQ